MIQKTHTHISTRAHRSAFTHRAPWQRCCQNDGYGRRLKEVLSQIPSVALFLYPIGDLFLVDFLKDVRYFSGEF